jgi:hypothetical protein
MVSLSYGTVLRSDDHDPAAVLDYQWNLADWLPPGDTITGATVTLAGYLDGAVIQPISLQDTNPVAIQSVSHTLTTVTVWVTGGNSTYSPYMLTCHFSTSGGRQEDRSRLLNIKEG